MTDILRMGFLDAFQSTHWGLDKNGHHIADNIWNVFFLTEKFCILIEFPVFPKLAPNDSIGNKSSLVQVMAWCQAGTKPLLEPVMIQLSDTSA